MLTPGLLLGNRYLLTDRIATGGMGAVWRCTDTLLARPIAVKVLLPALVADPEFTTRFGAEARMLAALRHPGIVQVHDVGTATLPDGSRVSYLVMEYVDGEPLVTWVRRAGRLDPATTMSVVARAARALHAAHAAGIVHRDVKPANLLVKRDGGVVLVDFGIARSGATAGITAAHTVLGTASYMSPEQAVGQPVSPATDVYALGAVAYYCLAGRPPFDGENPLQVALRHVQDAPAPLPPDTPPAVREVVRRALAKNPGDRYPSAAAMADAAEDARDATPVVRPGQPTAAEPTGGRAGWGRRLALAGAGGVVLLSVAVTVAVAARHSSGDTDRPERRAGVADGSAFAAPGSAQPVVTGTSARPTPGRTGRVSRSPVPDRTADPTTGASATGPTGGATASATPVPSATASAPEKPNPYPATQVCGSGYRVIDSAALTVGGVRQGRVYLLWNGGTGTNCVVTLKERNVGRATAVSAYLEVRGKTRDTASGSFDYYAGPVRAAAAGACVRWGGATGGASYASAFEHCG
ncbi:protein kinase [Micromonospora mangrovi]|uniref:non-specific serine/threonine protein kinase n=2 Tax=Micromonospora TaxID=1873 RepID=A0AAU8HF94_9ACTN